MFSYVFMCICSTTIATVRVRFGISIVYLIFVLERICFCLNSCICIKMLQCLPPTLINLIKSNNYFQVRNCHIFLYKYKFHTGLKFLFCPNSQCKTAVAVILLLLRLPRISRLVFTFSPSLHDSILIVRMKKK